MGKRVFGVTITNPLSDLQNGKSNMADQLTKISEFEDKKILFCILRKI